MVMGNSPAGDLMIKTDSPYASRNGKHRRFKIGERDRIVSQEVDN